MTDDATKHPLPSGLARMPPVSSGHRMLRTSTRFRVLNWLARGRGHPIAWRAATTPWSRLNTRDRRGGRD